MVFNWIACIKDRGIEILYMPSYGIAGIGDLTVYTTRPFGNDPILQPFLH